MHMHPLGCTHSCPGLKTVLKEIPLQCILTWDYGKCDYLISTGLVHICFKERGFVKGVTPWMRYVPLRDQHVPWFICMNMIWFKSKEWVTLTGIIGYRVSIKYTMFVTKLILIFCCTITVYYYSSTTFLFIIMHWSTDGSVLCIHIAYTDINMIIWQTFSYF